MAELYGLGLVTVGQQTGNSGSPEHFIELKEKFQWFLSEEFTSVRKNTPVSYDSSVRENTYQNSKNNDYDTESNNEAHRGKISYTYNQEEKPEGATYICKYCNKQQFTIYTLLGFA